MQYVISFLEGIISFISPCLLPMLPIYVTYFAADSERSGGKKTLINALGFVLGFTLVFLALGIFFATLGVFLQSYSGVVNFVLGAIVILFGLGFMGVIPPIFGTNGIRSRQRGSLGFFEAMIAFSSWRTMLTIRAAVVEMPYSVQNLPEKVTQPPPMASCFSASRSKRKRSSVLDQSSSGLPRKETQDQGANWEAPCSPSI